MQLEELWWLFHQYYFHQDGQHLVDKAEYLKKADRQLNDFFLLTKFRYLCEFINRKFNATDEFSLDYMEVISKMLEEYQGDNPAIQIYGDFYRLISEGGFDPQAYENEVKEKLIKRLPTLAKADQLVFVKFLINQLNRAIGLGHLHLLREIHNWNLIALDRGLYTFENVLSDDEYLNVAITASTLGEGSFFDSFIESYKDKMNAEVREKAYQTAKAFRHFHKSEYTQATDILDTAFPTHSQDSYKYILRARSLSLRCQLCLYLEDFDDQAGEKFPRDYQNFKSYLKYHEKNIAEKVRESYQNFMDISNDIFLAKKKEYSIRKATKNELLDKLKSMENVAVRIWLTTTIENLK